MSFKIAAYIITKAAVGTDVLGFTDTGCTDVMKFMEAAHTKTMGSERQAVLMPLDS